MHTFYCKKCSFKFSFESDEGDVLAFSNSLPKGIRCPKCDDKWGDRNSKIEQEVANKIGAVKSLKARRKENAESSRVALEQARAYAEQNPQEKQVEISRPSNFEAGRYGNARERVPEKVIESLQEKSKYLEDL